MSGLDADSAYGASRSGSERYTLTEQARPGQRGRWIASSHEKRPPGEPGPDSGTIGSVPASRQINPHGDSISLTGENHRRAPRWRRPLRFAGLVAVLLLAMFFRVVGHRWPADAIERPRTLLEEWASWDHNQHLHPDERFLSLVGTAIRLPGSVSEYLNTETSPANPHNVGYTFYPYGTWPLIATRALAGVVDRADYDGLTLVGRLLSAAADIATLILLFLLGRKLADETAAVVGVGLAACCVLSIQHARFWTMESLGTTVVLFSMLACALIADKGRWWSWPLAGFGVGVATATKISLWTVAGLVPLAALILVRHGPTRSLHAGEKPPTVLRALFGCVVAALIAVVTIRLLLPYAFAGYHVLDLRPNPKFLANLGELSRLMNGAADFPPALQWTDRTPYLYPLHNLFFWGLGPALSIAALIGWLTAISSLSVTAMRAAAAVASYAAILVVAGALGLLGGVATPIAALIAAWLWAVTVTATGSRDRLLPALAVAFIGMTLAYQGVQFVKPMRYLLPICPLLALLAGVVLVRLLREGWRHTAAQPRLARSALRAATTILVATVPVGTVAWAWGFSSIYRQVNTRIAASRWMVDHLPTAVSASLSHDQSTWRVPVEVFAPATLDPSNPVVSGRLRSPRAGTLESVQLLVGRPASLAPPETMIEVVVSDGDVELGRGPAAIRPAASTDAVVVTASVSLTGVGIDARRSYTVTVRLTGGQPVELRTSTIAVEDWDDALPAPLDGRDSFRIYRSLTLPTYADDAAEKLDTIVDILDEADVLVLSSHRGAASVQRIPRRYPLQNRFYQLLVNGTLGYEPVGDWTTWPRCGPWWLPDQEVVAAWPPQPGGLLRLPAAEEPFSVYDHPRVFIFRRSATFGRAAARALLEERRRPARHVSPRRATALAWELRFRRIPGVGSWLGSSIQRCSERIETAR